MRKGVRQKDGGCRIWVVQKEAVGTLYEVDRLVEGCITASHSVSASLSLSHTQTKTYTLHPKREDTWRHLTEN